MGAHKSLAAEADYASVLRTANRFRAEADQLRELKHELLEALSIWSHDGALQTFEDRERFRAVARALIAKADR